MDLSSLSPETRARLDAYEAAIGRRVAPELASAHRQEMEAHLIAEIAARRELGATPEAAESEALAVLGDLELAARTERRDPRDLALFLAPLLLLLGSFVGAWLMGGRSLRAVDAVFFVPTLVALWLGSAGRRRLRTRPLARGFALFVGPLLLGLWTMSPHGSGAFLSTVQFGLVLGGSLLGLHAAFVGISRAAARAEVWRGGFGVRVAAPVVLALLPLLGGQTYTAGLALLLLPVTVLGVGMVGRRRPDGTAAVLGSVLMILAFSLTTQHDLLSRMTLLGFVRSVVSFSVQILLVQTLWLGLFALLRRLRLGKPEVA